MVYSSPAPVAQFPKKESIRDLSSLIWRNSEGERIIAYAQLSLREGYNFIEPILFVFHVEELTARQRDRTRQRTFANFCSVNQTARVLRVTRNFMETQYST